MVSTFYKDIRAENLPMPDRQAMQLIQYTLKEDAEIDILSQLISVNPSLSVQLLGLVNSAFFGFRQSIKTIPEAVVATGMDQLRNLVFCFTLKEALSRNTIPGFDIDAFWEDSVRRGVAARQFGQMVGGSVEEAFTAGMMQDIGLLVLFAMEPDKVDRWPLLRSNLPDDRKKMEAELFHATHEIVGQLLVRKWNLPISYAKAIGGHHNFTSGGQFNTADSTIEYSVLTGTIHLADLCNAVYTCHDKARAVSELKSHAKHLFDLEEKRVESMLLLLPEQVKESSALMKISLGKQIDFNMVMEQANKKLVEDNLSYQELTWQLQRSLKERDEYAARLKAELDVAREIQKSLQPDIRQISQVGAFNIPAYQLSGDFYDYFSKDDGTICFCLGDVSGKGTSAALLMAKAISLFRCLCRVLDDMSRIIYLMNNELFETAVRGMFVTFVGGWLDPGNGQLKMINMGHLPPLLLRGKKAIQVGPVGPPLGVLPEASYPAKDFSLIESRLFLYTDGFTEGRLKTDNPTNPEKELGVKGFFRWLVQSRNMLLDEQVEWIKSRCKEELLPQSDDLTLMILSGEKKPS